MNPLSRIQEHILAMIADGFTSEQIGRRMGRTRSSIDNHAANILVLMGARSRPHAVAKAIRLGIIDVEAVRD